jgi:hypothetical protein
VPRVYAAKAREEDTVEVWGDCEVILVAVGLLGCWAVGLLDQTYHGVNGCSSI